MRTKRTSVSLSDDEINLLYMALDAYTGDMAASGEDPEHDTNAMAKKLLRARARVRAK